MVVLSPPSPRTAPPATRPPGAGVIKDARARQRRQRSGAASVALAVAALLVYFLAGGDGGAPTLRGWHGRSVAPPSAVPATTVGCRLARLPSSTTNASPAPALLATLSVLRRPAGPTDTLAPWAYVSYDQEVFVKYIRLARSVDGRAYWVIPAIIARCRPQKPVEGLTFRVADGGKDGLGGVANVGETVGRLREYGDFLAVGSTLQGLVPDGVAEVTLHYPAAPGRPQVTLSQRVIDNVVLFIGVPRPAPVGRGASMSWIGAGGRVIKTLNRL
jgi:hypothetical protein